MLLSGVRSSCDMLARNSDLYFEVSASSAAFSSRARRASSISLFLRSTSAFCSASCCAFCASCSFDMLELALPVLELGRELLRLHEQALGLHRRLDAVDDDAQVARQLLEEGELRRLEVAQRGEAEDRLDLALEDDRIGEDAARQRLQQHRAHRHGVGRHVGDDDPALVDAHWPRKPIADLEPFADSRLGALP